MLHSGLFSTESAANLCGISGSREPGPRMTPERLQSMAEFVMKNRGTGYSESVYHECLRTLLESKGIRYRSQVNLYT